MERILMFVFCQFVFNMLGILLSIYVRSYVNKVAERNDNELYPIFCMRNNNSIICSYLYVIFPH